MAAVERSGTRRIAGRSCTTVRAEASRLTVSAFTANSDHVHAARSWQEKAVPAPRSIGDGEVTRSLASMPMRHRRSAQPRRHVLHTIQHVSNCKAEVSLDFNHLLVTHVAPKC